MNCPTCNKEMQYDDGQDSYACSCGYTAPNGPALSAVVDDVAEQLEARGAVELALQVDAALQVTALTEKDVTKINKVLSGKGTVDTKDGAVDPSGNIYVYKQVSARSMKMFNAQEAKEAAKLLKNAGFTVRLQGIGSKDINGIYYQFRIKVS